MSPDQLAGILPLVLIVLAFWFLVIRPARKRQQEMTRIQNSVDVGAEVIVEEVLDAFAAHYDITVELVRTAEENIVFSLPRPLREAAA